MVSINFLCEMSNPYDSFVSTSHLNRVKLMNSLKSIENPVKNTIMVKTNKRKKTNFIELIS